MDKLKKECSNRQEETIAKYLGWYKVSGSGSRPCKPGDIYNETWLGECKTHIRFQNSIIFKFKEWDKINEEATSQFKNAVLFVDNGTQLIENTLCLLQISQYKLLEDINLPIINTASIRYNSIADIDPQQFIRNDQILCVMPLVVFKQFIEIGE